ncbi:MAG TPA: glycosyltransferase family 4 protein [Gemmatimonadaceae bacterium]|nr:glycosyltransferase family 4 protein [Gemmatimonadaceae bacterium]
MRVGIVTQSYYPRFGGVTEHAHHSAEELAHLGHDVTIVTSHFRGEGAQRPGVERVGRNLLVPFNRAFVDLTVGWNLESRLRTLFRRHAFDVIHVHGPPSPGLPLLAVMAAECPQVGTFHMTGRSRMLELVRGPLSRRIERLTARIAVSNTARDCAEHYFPGEYRVVPNGVDTDRFNPEQPPFRYWRSPDRVNILFVGRLDPRKGVKLLIEAVPELVRRTRGRARVMVIGDSYLRGRLEASVPAAMRGHIVFLGAVPPADLPRWYATADIFVSPATGNESFGIVLLEAMASGCPVVCSDIPGYRCAVGYEGAALLHAPGDSRGLTDAVCRLVEDARFRARLGAAGRLRALEFAWPVVAAQIESVYYAAANGGVASFSTA